MNGLNFNRISVLMVTSVAVLCCIRESMAAAMAQSGEGIFPDPPLAANKPNIRHVTKSQNSPTSTSPSIMANSELSTAGKARNDDSSDKSEEIDFLQKDGSKVSSPSQPTPVPASSTTQSNPAVLRNVSSSGIEYDAKTNASSLPSSSDGGVGVANSSESSPRSKVVRAAANDKETVVINADTDGAKLEGKESSGSNLWIYSNAVCILLVVGVSIFLIYYPKIRADRRNACNNPSQTSSESSTSASVSVSVASPTPQVNT